eukprot:scaffold307808_cov33-Tisochrysis_lutea.AAC.3
MHEAFILLCARQGPLKCPPPIASIFVVDLLAMAILDAWQLTTARSKSLARAFLPAPQWRRVEPGVIEGMVPIEGARCGFATIVARFSHEGAHGDKLPL